jgi:uncharacterized membrane protein YhdT
MAIGSLSRGTATMQSMLAIDYMAFAVAWVVGAWLVGVTAGNRGYSPVVWGVFSLFVSPVVGVVLLALVTPRRGPRAGS